MKTVIFGADKLGVELYFEIREEEEVVAFIDNNPDKQGKEILGIKVFSAEKLLDLVFDTIYIASSKVYIDISNQVEQMGIPKSKISFLPVQRFNLQNIFETLYCFHDFSMKDEYEEKWRNLKEKYNKIKIYRLCAYAIGELITDFFIIKNTCNENGVLRVFIPDVETYIGEKRICNMYLLELLGKYIYMVQDNDIALWSYILRIHHSEVDFSEYNVYAKRCEFPTYKENHSKWFSGFSNDEIKAGKKICEKMGLHKEYACIAARTDSYNMATIGNDLGAMYEYRNMCFEDYKETINYLQKEGITAVRMGKGEAKIQEIENCIDYAGNYADDFMDMFLVSNCKFMIGNTSGIIAIANFFAKPLLMVNCVSIITGYSGMAYTENDLYIPKKYFDIHKNRYLSLREIAQLELFCANDGRRYEQRGIKFIDNTPEEIAIAAWEMVERLAGRWQDNEIDKENKVKYRKIYHEMQNAGADMHDSWIGEPIPYKISMVYLRYNPYLLE